MNYADQLTHKLSTLTGQRITSDDLLTEWEAMQTPPMQRGPVMGRLVQQGWLRPTGRHVRSKRRARKGAEIKEYVVKGTGVGA